MRVFQDQRDVAVQEIINLPLSNLRLLFDDDLRRNGGAPADKQRKHISVNLLGIL